MAWTVSWGRQCVICCGCFLLMPVCLATSWRIYALSHDIKSTCRQLTAPIHRAFFPYLSLPPPANIVCKYLSPTALLCLLCLFVTLIFALSLSLSRVSSSPFAPLSLPRFLPAQMFISRLSVFFCLSFSLFPHLLPSVDQPDCSLRFLHLISFSLLSPSTLFGHTYD